MNHQDYANYMYLIETIGHLKEKMDDLIAEMTEDPFSKRFYFNLGKFCREFDELDDRCVEILEYMQMVEEEKHYNKLDS